MVPKSMILELKGNELKLYCFLDLTQGTSETYAAKGINYCAKELGMHPSTVRKAAESLKAAGIIAIEERASAERTSKGHKQLVLRILHNPSRRRDSPILNLIDGRPAKPAARRLSDYGTDAVLKSWCRAFRDVREILAQGYAEKPRFNDGHVREESAHVLTSFGVSNRSDDDRPPDDAPSNAEVEAELAERLWRASIGDTELDLGASVGTGVTS